MVKIITKKDLNEILNKDFNFRAGDSVISNTSEIKSNKTTDDFADVISQRYNVYSPFHNYGYFFENDDIKETLLPKNQFVDSLEDKSLELTSESVEFIDSFIETVNNTITNNYQKFIVLKNIVEKIKTNDNLLNDRLINILKEKNEKVL